MSALSRRFAPPLALAAVLLAGCTVQKKSTPSLSGPSSTGLSLSLAASPDVLPRDGSSVSTITISAKNVDGSAAQQRVVLSATSGSLSATDVTTNASGVATVQFTAPSTNQNVTSSTITAEPVDSANPSTAVSVSRTVTVNFTGPGVPVPAFTFSPASPGQYDLVNFDASSTTLNGVACGSACTYVFDFGDNTNSTAEFASHRFNSQGAFQVKLTVTAPGNTSASKTTTITVGTPQSLTAVLSVSPTDPVHGTTTVYVDGSGTKPIDGSAITNYAFDFGNGVKTSGSSPTASTVYATANTFTIRLTVTDSVGRTGTTTTTLQVK